MDIFPPEKRSRIMASVRGKDTDPEIAVRKILYRLGYRFRLHVKKLPGTPDIVVAKHRKVVLVHGCFWHGHPGCKRAKLPTTRREFWADKISKNIQRDARDIAALQELGYSVLIIWTCELRHTVDVEAQLAGFMRNGDGAAV